MSQRHDDWVQFGCGLCAPAEWTNFDSSPTLRLERMPLLGRVMPSGPYGRFPANVRYGDVVKGLPVRSGSVELLYCSHVLEHLSLKELRAALRNCRAMLRSGGVFRLVLPDLEKLIEGYATDCSDEAALKFIEYTGLGRVTRPQGIVSILRDFVGNSHHLWLWDYKSLSKELANAGFANVRRAFYLDSSSEPFRLVEDETRWNDALGIECSLEG